MAAIADILISDQNFSYFELQVAQCFLPSFKSIGRSNQEKKPKTDFKDGGHDGHLGFPIGTILAFFFNLQVTLMP